MFLRMVMGSTVQKHIPEDADGTTGQIRVPEDADGIYSSDEGF